MNKEFPVFKYHPDPIETGSVIPSENKCRCCGILRGFIYIGSVYSVTDLDDSICPWCIADGSAAEKFSASFSDDANLQNEGISDEILIEVTTRNPGYFSWQSEFWESHCDDACEYHGDASISDMNEMDSESFAKLSAELGLDESDWKTFTQNYSPGADPAVYKFICRHCGKVIYHSDCS